jgi:hypothetical protein
MGYGTGGTPRQSFAAGGITQQMAYGNYPVYDVMSTTAPPGTSVNWGSIGAIGQLMRVLNQGLNKLDAIGKRGAGYTSQFTGYVDALLTTDTGLFDRLNTAFGVIQGMISAAQVIGGRAAGFGASAAQRGYLSGVGAAFTATRVGVVRQALSPVQQGAQQLRGLGQEQDFLVGEQSLLQRTFKSVASRLRADPGSARLTAEYNSLLKRIQALTGTIAQGLSGIFAAEQAQVQNLLSRVSDIYSTQQSKLQAGQSTASARGDFGLAATFDTQLSKSATSQAKALAPALKEARKIGDTALVAQIQQQIDQLTATAAQAALSAIQDLHQQVDQAAQSKTSSIQSRQGIAQAMGDLIALPGLDKELVAAANAQIDELKIVLEKAIAGGDTAGAAAIKAEIDGLKATAAQAGAQAIQDQISAIQQGSQVDQAKIAMEQSLAQTMQSAASTPGQFTAAGAEGAQALQDTGTSLRGQLSAYNTLLGQAQAAGDTGAVASLMATIDGLTAQLAQNDQALQDNTAQTVAQTSQYIQSRGQFVTAVSGSNTSLQGTNSGLVGQLSQLGGGASGLAALLQGVTDPAKVASILAGANTSGIEGGHDAAWISSFEGIIQSLEGNTQAIATNNQQLAQLNGQLLQPQTWASMTWTAFRMAVFTGMGNLLPTYQSALPTGSAPSIAPVFGGVHSNQTSPTIGQLNITSPTEVLDPQLLGAQLHHELSTAP